MSENKLFVIVIVIMLYCTDIAEICGFLCVYLKVGPTVDVIKEL